jgi:hypothetical protein
VYAALDAILGAQRQGQSDPWWLCPRVSGRNISGAVPLFQPGERREKENRAGGAGVGRKARFRGITAGIGAIAGTAAAFDPEPISKAVLAGVAFASQIVTSIFGDPKAIRDAQISRELRRARYLEPTALSLSFDERGNYYDYDASGNVRRSTLSNFPINAREPAVYRYGGDDFYVPGADLGPPGLQPPGKPGFNGAGTNLFVSIQTMDARSFLDNHEIVGQTLRKAIQNGNPVNEEIQRLINP